MNEIAQDQLLKMLDDIETRFGKQGKIEDYIVDYGVEVVQDKFNLCHDGEVPREARVFKTNEKKSAAEFLYSYPDISLKLIPYAIFFSIKTYFAEHFIRAMPVQGIAYVDYNLNAEYPEYKVGADEDEEKLIKTIQKYGFEVRRGEPESSVEVKKSKEPQEPVSLGSIFG